MKRSLLTGKKDCEEDNSVLGLQRAGPFVYPPICQPPGSTLSKEIRSRGLVGGSCGVHSAICRLHREHLISDPDKQGALARLRLLSRGWKEVFPDDQVRDLAAESLDKYVLRAADALQLAASLIWCQKRPARRNFICSDRRLAQAADAAGFLVLEIPTTIP